MCVAAVAWDAHPDWLLVVAGNRDEFHARPAAPLAPRPDGIIAGTDLTGGGTWLGVTEAGRFALVTNYRVPEGSLPGRPSRGKLVTDLLEGVPPADLTDAMAQMNPFNLILAYPDGASFLTNHRRVEMRPLSPGIHGLSNGGFDVPWPKTLQVGKAIERWFENGLSDPAPLLDTLRDETPAPAAKGPELGPEPRFAPVFIRDPIYGTRCSTVITIDRASRGTIVERSFDADGLSTGEVRIDFVWPLPHGL
ncbi:MAG: NRDE family protein [Novosphingobium sp.]